MSGFSVGLIVLGACHCFRPLLHFLELTFYSQRLVRFLARDGCIYYGDAILQDGVSDIARARQARVIRGDIFGKHHVTDEVAVSTSMSSAKCV